MCHHRGKCSFTLVAFYLDITPRGDRDDVCVVLQGGELISPSVKKGDEVLLPEFGGTKITLEEQVSSPSQEYHLCCVSKATSSPSI